MADIHQKLQEEKLLRAIRARRRFKAAFRHVLHNMYWLDDEEDDVDPNNLRNTYRLARKKKPKQGFSFKEKVLLRKKIEHRTKEEIKHLHKFIGGLQCFRQYPEEVQLGLVGVTFFEYFGPGKTLIKQDQEGHALYILLSGAAVVRKRTWDEITNEFVEEEVATIVPGKMFGEISLLHNIPRTATVATTEPCELLVLNREDFDRVLKASLMEKWQAIREAMSKFVYFDDWNNVKIRECCLLSKIKTYSENQVVYGDRIQRKGVVKMTYFITEGSCKVVEHMFIEETVKHGIKYYKMHEIPNLDVEEKAPSIILDIYNYDETNVRESLQSKSVQIQDSKEENLRRTLESIGVSKQDEKLRETSKDMNEENLTENESNRDSKQNENIRKTTENIKGSNQSDTTRKTTENIRGSKQNDSIRKTTENISDSKEEENIRNSSVNNKNSKQEENIRKTTENIRDSKQKENIRKTNENIKGSKQNDTTRKTTENIRGSKQNDSIRKTTENIKGSKQNDSIRKTTENLRGSKQNSIRKTSENIRSSKQNENNRKSTASNRSSKQDIRKTTENIRQSKQEENMGKTSVNNLESEQEESKKRSSQQTSKSTLNEIEKQSSKSGSKKSSTISEEVPNVSKRRQTKLVHDFIRKETVKLLNSDKAEGNTLSDIMNQIDEPKRSEHLQVSVISMKHMIEDERRKTVDIVHTSLKTIPQSFDLVFMQICTLSELASFSEGDLMKNRRVIALSPLKVLVIPTYWLIEHNKGNVWTRIERHLQHRIPNTKQVFEAYKNNKKWQEYKKKLRDEILSRKKICNNTTIHDVPYSIRIMNNY